MLTFFQLPMRFPPHLQGTTPRATALVYSCSSKAAVPLPAHACPGSTTTTASRQYATTTTTKKPGQ